MLSIEEMNQIRKEYGISYDEIYKNSSSISKSTIQKIFGGFVEHPRKSTIERLSLYFEKFLKENDIAIANYNADDIKYVAEERSFAYKSDLNGTNSSIYTQKGYTYDDYKKLELPNGKRVEVIDGTIYDMSSPTIVHQRILMNLMNQIYNYIAKNKGKCEVFLSPIDVRLDYNKGDMTVVQPDLIIVCNPEILRNNKNVTGAPDFILEVISKSSRKMDMYTKLAKYKESGVREYWIVDYENEKIIKYNFTKDDEISIWGFNENIPVDIYEGKLRLKCEL